MKRSIRRLVACGMAFLCLFVFYGEVTYVDQPSNGSDAIQIDLRKLLNAETPEACGHASGLLENGELTDIPPESGYVKLSGTTRRSALLGRTSETLAVRKIDSKYSIVGMVECSAGGAVWPDVLVVWDAHFRVVAYADMGTAGAGRNNRIKNIQIKNDTVIVVSWEGAHDTDPACCNTVSYSGELDVTQGYSLMFASKTISENRGEQAVMTMLTAAAKGHEKPVDVSNQAWRTIGKVVRAHPKIAENKTECSGGKLDGGTAHGTKMPKLDHEITCWLPLDTNKHIWLGIGVSFKSWGKYTVEFAYISEGDTYGKFN